MGDRLLDKKFARLAVEQICPTVFWAAKFARLGLFLQLLDLHLARRLSSKVARQAVIPVLRPILKCRANLLDTKKALKKTARLKICPTGKNCILHGQ